MQTLLITWLHALMLWTLPPERVVPTITVEARKETVEERSARYESIAGDVIATAFDPAEAPLFAGTDGRAKTAATLLGLTRYESDWHRDVDDGTTRGDHKRAWCIGQVLLDADGVKKTPEGWTGPDLVADRTRCLRVVLRMARESFRACRALPVEERLAVYARGSCDSVEGQKLSRTRMKLAFILFAHAAPPKLEATALAW